MHARSMMPMDVSAQGSVHVGSLKRTKTIGRPASTSQKWRPMAGWTDGRYDHGAAEGLRVELPYSLQAFMAAADPYAIDVEGCRRRQTRLLAAMEAWALELAILSRNESVQWLTGAYLPPPMTPAAAINAAGLVTLVLPERKLSMPAAADVRLPYEAKLLSTNRDDQRAASTAVLLAAIGRPLRGRVGGEWSCAGPQLQAAFDGLLVDVEPTVFRLRRRKETDELRMLARANDANRAMYARAREIVKPGLNELDLYNELHAAAVSTLREPLTYLGQDFQAGRRGGPPRDRVLQGGELIILDLGVGFRGYYSDNARTLVVDGEPTKQQSEAWHAASEIFDLVRAEVRPGTSCRVLFETAKRQLGRRQPWVFNHHLGHGVGLAPQEGPHLNPRWDDAFEEGDFIAVEPGLYHEELKFGVRLEQNFVVTASGVELVTDFPLEL